jgi:hypothetical protein
VRAEPPHEEIRAIGRQKLVELLRIRIGRAREKGAFTVAEADQREGLALRNGSADFGHDIRRALLEIIAPGHVQIILVRDVRNFRAMTFQKDNQLLEDVERITAELSCISQATYECGTFIVLLRRDRRIQKVPPSKIMAGIEFDDLTEEFLGLGRVAADVEANPLFVQGQRIPRIGEEDFVEALKRCPHLPGVTKLDGGIDCRESVLGREPPRQIEKQIAEIAAIELPRLVSA